MANADHSSESSKKQQKRKGQHAHLVCSVRNFEPFREFDGVQVFGRRFEGSQHPFVASINPVHEVVVF